ncbi:unnamed protein product [Adineta ricciae]|uniref:Gag-like protein n=1 Tax=Adineta ricciae TaxID=249248 RepID=A0A815EC05_ADIRI|nr:unnamed protein product [Adineta ricciae]CAF1312866.1 unnamed protein product [Adineta ricciae]
MASAKGVMQTTAELVASPQEATPIESESMEPNQAQLNKQKSSKRTKGTNDSFEEEHRLAPKSNQYFNNNFTRPTTNSASTAQVRHPDAAGRDRQVTFPPFKIDFTDDTSPTELSIIKDINKSCKICLSFGRYSQAGKKKSFLLYANSNEQYERLLDKSIWPAKICSNNYKLIMPSKVPSSYSLIATGVPAQWDLAEFELDVKKKYKSITKVERMLVGGGRPIAKVRIDFSSKAELQTILKNKRILIDEENTSFQVLQYHPPVKILRCFNCQEYNSHIAADCPRKENPTCYRCAQNHEYDPNCQNKIRCANCQGDHLAGNPNCPVKIEERLKFKASTEKRIGQQQRSTTVDANAWSNSTRLSRPVEQQPSTAAAPTPQQEPNGVALEEFMNKLDMIGEKIDKLSKEQSKIVVNFECINKQLKSCQDAINMFKCFVLEQICPLLIETSKGIMIKKSELNTQKLLSMIENVNKGLDPDKKKHVDKARQRNSTVKTNASQYESAGEDI